MCKVIILLAFTTLLCGCSTPSRTSQPSLVGRWEGVAEIPDKRTEAVVDFSPDANGQLCATISVPDERLLGKPLISVQYESPHLHFELQASEQRIIFDGTRSSDVISGTIEGGDIRAPFSLRFTGDVPPPPYAQEEVRFRNGDVKMDPQNEYHTKAGRTGL